MAPPSEHAVAVSSRLDGVVVLDLAVTATEWVAPGLRSLHATGDLTGFEPVAGQDLMVPVAVPSGRARWRRYTVRRVDRARSTLELWITTESGGPGANWAGSVAVGDSFEAVGPRGKVRLDPLASTHVFVVDTAGLAAMLAMAESIAGPATVHAVGILDHLDAPAAAVERAAGVAGSDSWRVRTDAASDERWALDWVDSAARNGLLDGPSTAAYVFAELSVTLHVAAALAANGVAKARIAAKPYWRAGMANQDHGEPDKALS